MAEYTTGGRSAVAIPAFNEGNSIISVVQAARKHVDEVIVIDDGSSDWTAHLAVGAGAVVECHDHNRGKAMAIMTAFEIAANRGIDYLVLLDGDGQHNPDEIPQLLAPLQTGAADVVVGSRYLDVRNPIPFYRTIGQRVLNVATHIGSGIPCSDSQCGYRSFNRRAFSSIRLAETFLHGLAAESEMQFEIAMHRLRLAEVPVYVHYDEKARRSPLKHGFGVLYRVMAMIARRQKRRAAPGQPVSIRRVVDAPSHGASD